MSETRSPSPEKGQLRIYFSYTAAAPKTNVMLHDALAESKAGRRVAVGDIGSAYVQDACGLDMLPRVKNGSEPDLDRALALHPDIILLCDPAHVNSENCRHQRRFSEIAELLRSGITVYTTLDLCALESLKDLTPPPGEAYPFGVPDKLFDRADEVLFVDLPVKDPESPEGVHLSSLRELALRRLADRIKKQPSPSHSRGYTANEHILVCLSPSPSCPRVIRSASRLARAFHGSLTAIYVQSGTIPESQKDQERLRGNIKLAEQLGARITTVYGGDPAVHIAEYALASGVTKIVIGRTNHRSGLRSKALADRLTQLVQGLDVYIIPDSSPTPYRGYGKLLKTAFFFTPSDLAKTFALTAAASGIGWIFYAAGLRDADIITVYILGILITAIWTKGRFLSALSAMLNVIVFNFLFTEPRFTLFAYDAGYPVTFLIMLISGLITSSLAMRIKTQARQSARKAYRTEALLETSRLLQKAENEEEILSFTAKQLIKLLERPVIFYLAQEDGLTGQVKPYMPSGASGPLPEKYISETERQTALWVWANNKHAGAFTDTLPRSKCLYLAVRGRSGPLSVAAFPAEGYGPFEAYERSLMVAILDECGMALEKDRLMRLKQQAEMAVKQESLRANLLRAISHDLRTPLTSITGSAGILLETGDSMGPETRKRLYLDIYDDSRWLISLVENLLSVTRLENGSVNMNIQPELLEDVLNEALSHLDRRSCEHEISLSLKNDLLMAYMDSTLMTQVIINIVNNAIKYTPAGSHIKISGFEKDGQVIVEISDDGPGIPMGSREKIFDMFYTAGAKASADGRRGLGLGLALCRSIISAHGGTISVRDNVPHGAVFSFNLKAVEVNTHE